jgi:hypothetical protein
MRLLAVLLAGLLCFALASCPGGGGDDDSTGMTDNNGSSDDGDSGGEDVWDE